MRTDVPSSKLSIFYSPKKCAEGLGQRAAACQHHPETAKDPGVYNNRTNSS